MRKLAVVLSVFLALVLAPSFMSAQNTGSVGGKVVDPTGGVVKGASVVVKNEASGEIAGRTATDQSGKFSVTGLSAGKYTVAISAGGFSQVSRTGISVGTAPTQDINVTLPIGTVSQEITVDAETSNSVAAQAAPMDALLDETSARTEINPTYIQNFTSPNADFGELIAMAPGTFSINTNGIGLAQDKTFFRGFPDGDYDIDFDGVPFYDTNTPTHHTWSFFPDPWVGSVDFDRSPGSASTIGPTPFGGTIHLLSPSMLEEPMISGSISDGSFGTVFADMNFDSGPFMGRKANVSIDAQHMQSNGYQTYNYQNRNATSMKYMYKFSESNVLTGYSGLVWLTSNTPNNNPTRAQIATYGNNFISTNTCAGVAACTDPLDYKFYTYAVPTDFEYVGWTKQWAGGWQTDFKPYTLRYHNAQYYDNPSYNADGLTFAVAGGSATPGIGPVSAVDKLNSYRKYGEMFTASQYSKNGILRVGVWYEWATTNRFQIPSDPQTHVDAALPNFHENFWTNSAQPFAEYEYRVTPKLTVTAGFKYSYFNQDLKQYQDNGKTVGCIGGTLVGNPKTTQADSCNGGSPFTTHSAGYSSYLPSLDISYHLRSNWSVYSQYATGTIIPPSSVFDVTGGVVTATPKPTGATTLQSGSVLKLKQVTLNADYYHTHYQNTYVAVPDPNNPSAVDYTTAGDSVTQGVEAETNVYVTRGFNFYINGTAGTAKYVTVGLPSDGLWVANTPNNTQAIGGMWQTRNFEVGLFDKRVSNMWNDNTASVSVPAATAAGNGSLIFSGTNPAGNPFSVTYVNSTAAVDKITLTTNQVIPIQAFNVANFYFNYTLKVGSRLDGTKFRISFNNIFDSHNIVGVAQATAGTQANPWLYTGGSLATGAADQLTMLPGRSIALTMTIPIALSPR